MYLFRDSYVGMDSYKEFICIYGRIHIRSSHISMEGLIKLVHICLSRNLYVGSDSCKKFICIYGLIQKTSSHISRQGFICRERLT